MSPKSSMSRSSRGVKAGSPWRFRRTSEPQTWFSITTGTARTFVIGISRSGVDLAREGVRAADLVHAGALAAGVDEARDAVHGPHLPPDDAVLRRSPAVDDDRELVARAVVLLRDGVVEEEGARLRPGRTPARGSRA